MKFDYYTYQIGGHYLSAIINGDTSGLSDDENQELNLFLNNLPVNIGHFDVQAMDFNNGTKFTTCEVSNLYSECYEVRLYFPLLEAAV
jgi:hypothetical protein